MNHDSQVEKFDRDLGRQVEKCDKDLGRVELLSEYLINIMASIRNQYR
jgi:hypothetical protein